eukprot:5510094-Pyramimonas_sp.AAC.3
MSSRGQVVLDNTVEQSSLIGDSSTTYERTYVCITGAMPPAACYCSVVCFVIEDGWSSAVRKCSGEL